LPVSAAERVRRAKITNAGVEQQAAEKRVEADQILAKSPGAVQLRFLASPSETASAKCDDPAPSPLDVGRR
jgi:hypothetical protein